MWPAFNAAAVCPKCAGDDINTVWCTDRTECRFYNRKPRAPFGFDREHMHRTCRRCSYAWLETPLCLVDGQGLPVEEG